MVFLDVLGFSSLLEKKPLSDIHSIYAGFIDYATTNIFYRVEGKEPRPNFAFTQFVSDSLICVSNEITDVYNVNSFLAAVTSLVAMGFVAKLPLRGAIGRGDFLIDEERNIFLSPTIPEVVEYEHQQEWSGCIILESAEEIIIDAICGVASIEKLRKNQLGNRPIYFYGVPMKKVKKKARRAKRKKAFVLNYLFFLSDEQVQSGLEYLIEPKKSNVQDYYRFMKSLPFEYQLLSEEFRPAEKAVSIVTRSGCTMSFLDKDNKWCRPGVNEFTYHVSGRWR